MWQHVQIFLKPLTSRHYESLRYAANGKHDASPAITLNWSSYATATAAAPVQLAAHDLPFPGAVMRMYVENETFFSDIPETNRQVDRRQTGAGDQALTVIG